MVKRKQIEDVFLFVLSSQKVHIQSVYLLLQYHSIWKTGV